MVVFNNRVHSYFYTKWPLLTPMEFTLKMVGHSNVSKMLYCPHNIFIIPNYHGPFPVDYHFSLRNDDVIFDTSPAGYQPWRVHRKHLKYFFTFKYSDVTKYSLETINKTIHQHDIDKLKNHFKNILLLNIKNFDVGAKRYVFLCNVPRCVTHIVMATAFMEIFSMDFYHACHLTDYKPTFMERFLVADKKFSNSFQYIEWTSSAVKTYNNFEFNYDPHFFEEEDLYFGQVYDKHMVSSPFSADKNLFKFKPDKKEFK